MRSGSPGGGRLAGWTKGAASSCAGRRGAVAAEFGQGPQAGDHPHLVGHEGDQLRQRHHLRRRQAGRRQLQQRLAVALDRTVGQRAGEREHGLQPRVGAQRFDRRAVGRGLLRRTQRRQRIEPRAVVRHAARRCPRCARWRRRPAAAPPAASPTARVRTGPRSCLGWRPPPCGADGARHAWRCLPRAARRRRRGGWEIDGRA